jgi:TRAP-type C4-dicarboxylate transport system permease small subunit
MIVAVGVNCAHVVGRDVLLKPFVWAGGVVQLMYLWIVVLGAAGPGCLLASCALSSH